MAGATPALAIGNLSKRFGGALALDGVDLTVDQREVHGLLGQNGSGKSTLIKVLSGFHAPEPGGSLRIYGKPHALPLPAGRFRQLGIAFVHQNLGLMPSLSVVENMRLSDFATAIRLRIDWAREVARTQALFDRFDLAIDPRSKVAELSQVNRCLLAIVRALDEVESSQAEHGGQGILVLDEPTPFLPQAGVQQLFALVRQVREAGASVIFVSHDIGEIMEITDRATVLRDGRVAGTIETASARHDDFVELIIGRRVEAFHLEHRPPADSHIEIEVTDLAGDNVSDINFTARKGEVIGLAGLIGTGFDEVPALLFGARKARSGSLVVGEVDFDLRAIEPDRAIDRGIAYLPADRLSASGAGGLSVADNVTLPSLSRFRRGAYLDRQAMAAWAADVATRHDVRPNAPGLPLASLSGGNQQKALLAKWLETGPRLLLLDEPTQGVDVGARQQVYEAIGQAVDGGTTVICASTDYEQLAQICDRVLIFARGSIVSELAGSAVTKQAIAQACYDGMAQTAAPRQATG